MANTIVWFDLPVANLERATKFYSKVLDKKLDITESHGFKMTVFPHAENSCDVAGCLYEDNNVTPHTCGMLIYFDVNKRIHDAVTAATNNGGKVVSGVEPIGPWGFRAIVLDSEGNKIALHAVTER